MVKLFIEDTFSALAQLPNDSVDMLLVDLPYGTTACKWDSVIPLDRLWEEYYRVVKHNGAMVFTAPLGLFRKLVDFG